MAAAVAAVALIGVLSAGCAAAPRTGTAVPPTRDPTPSPTASASAFPDPTVGVLADAVPVAPPTHLSFPAADIDGAVEEYSAADAEAEGGINPPRLDTISWYSGVADALPGSAATNAVYLFGHTWTQPAVFNGLRNVAPGDEATVTTLYGEMTYRVDEIITMAKSDFTEDPRVAAIVPGRLALVSCFRPQGLDAAAQAPENIVVLLHLVGARPLEL